MRLQYLKTPENSCVSDAVFPLLVHFSVFGLARTGPFWVYPELICMRSVFSSIFWYLICHRWFQFLMLIPNNWGRFSFWRINQKWWYLRNLYYECIQYFLMMVWPPPLTPFFWKKHGKRGLRNRHSRQVKGWRVKTTRKSCTSWHVKRDEPCGSIHITSWKQQLWCKIWVQIRFHWVCWTLFWLLSWSARPKPDRMIKTLGESALCT